MPPRIVVVEPVSSGNALVEHAHALGWDVLVASHDRDDRALTPHTRALAGEVLTVDTNDEAALEAALKAAHQRAPLDGVVAGCEFYVPAVARLCRALGLPGLDPARVDLVRHKARMREAVAAAGVAGPRFAAVDDVAETGAACAHVGFPAVVKPVESSGSIHVTRVEDVAAARAAVAAIRAEDELDLGRELNHQAIIEQYVPGDEYSADGYVLDGRVVVAAVTRKLLGPEPWFVELGHLTPAVLDPAVRTLVDDHTSAVARAVGITSGPFHCEFRLDAGRPVLMEIAARLPGDRIVDLVELATGVALPRVALAAATGRDPAALGAFRAPAAAAAGIRFLTADGLPSYDALTGWDELAHRPWLVSRHVIVPPGEPLPPAVDFRCRVASVLFTAISPEAAGDRWTALGDEVRAVRTAQPGRPVRAVRA
ncbi:hypothetical protein GCM10010218_32500 [Streptomyces mashuensis]|uniref:ATP-grasp domain-containing protein n=1 Tax=Streptomyces mashuensis TaxID=33904 RepID=A0A919B361_9ACTN|nr:ATP-grasp domain-containing protein [Streptomyces mashuensis]GHF48517.1 hypothetical protein GCM10010218_32500 [Streptomyces mashuensis]